MVNPFLLTRTVNRTAVPSGLYPAEEGPNASEEAAIATGKYSNSARKGQQSRSACRRSRQTCRRDGEQRDGECVNDYLSAKRAYLSQSEAWRMDTITASSRGSR